METQGDILVGRKYKKAKQSFDKRIEVINGDINRALRNLKKKVQNGGILNDLRKKEFYQSRGTKVRLQKAAGKRRWLKKQADMLPQKRF